jgi:hypothetical protein
MVAFIPALSMWVVGLWCAHQILKPRLPHYSFQIKKFPVWKWVNGQLKTRLGAGVRLRNDNYVPIDVHALSFDLFYPDWHGTLAHIGNVQDTQQGQKEKGPKLYTQYDNNASIITTTSLYYSASHTPLWALLPRQSFETDDNVYVQPAGGIKVLSSLGWDLVRQGGTLSIPSSGVIQIKAHSKLPLTLSILCDNLLDVTTLEMQGIECELESVDMGWVHLPTAVTALRQSVLETHHHRPSSSKTTDNQISQTTTTTSFLGKKPVPPSFHEEYEKLARRVDWKDVMPMLTF